MTLLDAFILGLVEGITEFLPVSSTGHLIIVASLLGLHDGEQAKAAAALEVVIQGGAILAVLLLYRQRVIAMLAGVRGNDPVGRRLFVNILVAFLPAALLGPLIDDWLEAHLFRPTPVLLALALGGVLMIIVGRRGGTADPTRTATDRQDVRRPHLDLEALSLRAALIIGLCQCLSMWPGTSRAMVTILGGMAVGLSAVHAAEFSFLLGLPTLGAASAYKLLKNLKHAADSGTPNLFEVLGWPATILSMLVAAASAALAVRWLVGFLGRRGIAPFGWYRIALAAVLSILAWAEIVTIG